ncbi:ribonuclease III [Novosphingobium sp. APW14]|jgi:ribonuclease III|uniref:ribonuclease III n=1 Tax=Novosphingobium sp. APW14 TaxID=3077237 RepID=UPI0028DF7FC7|nr:ribonuclease III [Novosphingobium sp. APW14]MDT9012831.1 ribonuclease III [Novosphingobium sp. APW14]
MFAKETHAFLTEIAGRPPVDEALWLEALTHGSTGAARDYQRLEFLGDRVLGLAIAEWLHAAETGDEGRLSQRLNALVSRATCARIARSIGLGSHIRLGKQARDDGGADSDNILGDVMEALIGASFVTHGFEETRAMVRRLWADAVSGQTGQRKHPKSALQEWCAGNRRRMPEYRLVERSGPDHAARFTVAVSVPGVGEAEAIAGSKQEAETKAAEEFMRRFG